MSVSIFNRACGMLKRADGLDTAAEFARGFPGASYWGDYFFPLNKGIRMSPDKGTSDDVSWAVMNKILPEAFIRNRNIIKDAETYNRVMLAASAARKGSISKDKAKEVIASAIIGGNKRPLAAVKESWNKQLAALKSSQDATAKENAKAVKNRLDKKITVAKATNPYNSENILNRADNAYQQDIMEQRVRKSWNKQLAALKAAQDATAKENANAVKNRLDKEIATAKAANPYNSENILNRVINTHNNTKDMANKLALYRRLAFTGGGALGGGIIGSSIAGEGNRFVGGLIGAGAGGVLGHVAHELDKKYNLLG